MDWSDKGNKVFQTDKVALLAFSHLTHDVYTAFLAIFLPFLIAKYSLSLTDAGLLNFLVQIPSLMIPLIGIYADKYKLKYLVIITPALTASAMSLIPIADSYFQVCFLLVLAGLSSAIYHVPTPVMIRRLSGDKIGRGMSFFMVGGELARTIGPIFITSAISYYGFEGSYRVLAPGIIISIALFFQINGIPEDNSKKNAGPGFFIVLKRLRKLFIIIGGFVFFKTFLAKALTSFMPTYLTEKGEDIWFAGAALAIVELSGVFGAFMSGTISDRIGRKPMLLIISIASPIAMYFFLISGGIPAFTFLIILGILNFSINPVLLALVQDNESEYPTSANSIFMAISFGASSFLAFLFGFFSDIFSLEEVYYFSAGIYLLGIPFIMALPKDGIYREAN